MNYRIVMSNFTITVGVEMFNILTAKMSQPAEQWQPLEVNPGKWIVPAHVIAIETVELINTDPAVMAFPTDS